MAKAGKIIKRSFKVLLYLIIILVNGILIGRLLFSGDPSELKVIMVNENTAAVWQESGKEMKLETQKQRTITSDGLFSVTSCVFIPEAEQIQVTVRYNNSTLRKLAQDYELEAVPERKSKIFDVSIVKTIDLTPDDPEDNTDKDKLREERYFPGEVKEAYKTLYSYRKFIFDNVTYEDAVGMFVDVYYVEDIDYEDKPYGALCIYDALMPLEERELSSADIKALKKWTK